MTKKAIGLFDSGIGGLSILAELQKEFPNENFIYLADQNNYPYGIKGKKELRLIVSKAINFLTSFNLKAVIIACNTASAYSDHININIPLKTIIKPICQETINLGFKNILLIATEATVKSGLYKKCLQAKKINLFEYAAPNFVNLVEEFKHNDKESLKVIKKELKPFLNKQIEGVILGCTHFNFLKSQLKTCFPQAVLIDGIKELSKDFDLQRKTNENGTTRLYTTGELNVFKDQIKSLNIKFDKVNHVTI